MKKLEDLLIEIIRGDVDYLMQEVYVPSVKSNSRYLNSSYFKEKFDKMINSGKVEINDIHNLIGKNVSDDYMLELIKSFCDSNLSFNFYSEIDRIHLIPMFKYFLDKDFYSSRLICSFFLPIHCSGQMSNMFLNDKIRCKADFNVNYTFISGVEHLLGTNNCKFDLKTVIYYLNFINFESRNALVHKESEYFERLCLIRNELENTLSFYASDEFILKYNISKNGFSWKENYTDSECVLSLDNLNLIKNFYDGKINQYTNKYFQLKELENNMINAVNKKEMLLCAFCYKDYCNNEFFNAFNDVFLTTDDLYDFISKCESSDLKFTDRQINNLLHSFNKYYLDKNDLVCEHEEEKKHILEAYDRYCVRNWVFEKSEFIDFYNSLYNKKFKTFNFNNDSSLLTEDILDEVIADKVVMPEQVKNTNSVKTYLKNKKISHRESYCSDLEYRKFIFDKYYNIVSEYCSNPEMTIHYFMYRNGVSEDDEKTVKMFIDWSYANSNNLNDLFSNDLKVKTVNSMLNDFDKDILSSFKDCSLIYKKYQSIIENDGLSDFVSKKSFQSKYTNIRHEHLLKVKDVVVEMAKMALNYDLSGNDIFDNLDLSLHDIKTILKKNNINYDSLFETKKNFSVTLSRKIMNNAVVEYMNSDASLIDICKKYGYLPKTISDYVLMYRDIKPEFCDDFFAKAINNNDIIDNNYIDVEGIVSNIINGVVSANGEVRDYNYFDLMMAIGYNVNLREAKKLLMDYSNDYRISAFFGNRFNISNLKFVEGPKLESISQTSMTLNIKGNVHVVTPEETATVLNFLKERDFPSCLYYDAMRSYLNGEFDPREEKKIKVKTNDVE